jgi:hypothetical protein
LVNHDAHATPFGARPLVGWQGTLVLTKAQFRDGHHNLACGEAGGGGGSEQVIPRGAIFGRRVGDPPKHEAEHFIRYPAFGGWIDCRDLAQVFEHEGPLPHPAQDRPQ